MQFNPQVIAALTGCKITQVTGEQMLLDNGQPLYFTDSEIEALNSLWAGPVREEQARPPLTTITIQHQQEKTNHSFEVVNPDKLTRTEVATICNEMRVPAILINGKYYENKG